MKKFVMCAIALIMLAVSSQAQQRFTPLLDSNVNAETENIVANTLAGKYGYYSFQYVGTKISGTVAGKVYLEASLDGTNYGTIIDSLTLADQTTNTKIFDVANKRRAYYRFRIVTSGGSQVLVNKGYWLTQEL